MVQLFVILHAEHAAVQLLTEGYMLNSAKRGSLLKEIKDINGDMWRPHTHECEKIIHTAYAIQLCGQTPSVSVE